MYNHRVNRVYIESDIFKTKLILAKKVELFTNGSSGMTHAKFLSIFSPKFNAFHFKTRWIWQKVADKMRKIYAGSQDFSPQGQVLRDTIDFWKSILKRKRGVMTSRAAMQKLAKRLHFSLKTLLNNFYP